ncbi:hypothetical protein NP511_17935 [Natrinema thermotolerans]|uniref:Uncharacterized protein n=1 Tax=Natrinema thermotolerans TaxID=121872 RepID=A0AAF0PB17_9EURY|nr:hypothetical protein [Natrinema thermotolerans]QCC60239.1 hypothetical protein DVR14_17015 [Natrinema thermotolerans]QCC61151.1 hypothetical protein DVR14_21145 [Natrinema thermotolerans]WMT07256.1 hypothetical protein NP511_17935 [Natrinema thermotolerans]
MSAVDELDETTFSERALKTNLVPLVSVAFLGGSGFTILMGQLGFREYPLIYFLWEWMYTSQIAEHVLNFGTLFSLMSLVFGVLKFWLNDSLLENVSTVAYVLMAAPALWIADYPVNLVSLSQGTIIVLLQTSFLLIPGVLLSWFRVPKQTDNEFVKAKVFIGTFVLAAVMTLAAVVGMGLLECGLGSEYSCF